MPNENPGGSPSAEKDPFIRETLLQKKGAGAFWKKLLTTLALAVVFGLVSSACFYLGSRLFKPHEPRESEPVVFPTETQRADLPPSVIDSRELEAYLREWLEKELPREMPGGTDYKAYSEAIRQITQKLSRSIVTVTATNRSVDIFNAEYLSDTSTFGVIIAATSQEIVILAPAPNITLLSEDSTLEVTFPDGSVQSAIIKGTDRTDGLAAISVLTDALPPDFLRTLSIAPPASSQDITIGTPVIALGAPQGFVGSFGTGTVTYVRNDVPAVDGSYRILYTNIYGATPCQGVLFDLDGDLIGWIDRSYNDNSLITAIGISQLRANLESISNGRSVGLLGIAGVPLPDELRTETVTGGLYILSCAEDSPDMTGGLQSGDILTQLGTSPIASTADLQNFLRAISTEQTVRVTFLRPGGPGGQEYREMTLDIRITTR